VKLKDSERQEVEHWRSWVAKGGGQLLHAPMAIEPLLAIIDRVAPRKAEQKDRTNG
jgi:hypothetical protein